MSFSAETNIFERANMEFPKCCICNENHPVKGIAIEYSACVSCINNALKEYQQKSSNSLTYTYNLNEIDQDLKDYIIGFGKHKGKKILDIDSGYIKWCLENFSGLRDIDVFQKALETMTGNTVERPAANLIEKKLPLDEKIEILENDTEEDFPF